MNGEDAAGAWQSVGAYDRPALGYAASRQARQSRLPHGGAVKAEKIYQVSIHFHGGGMSLRYVQADSGDEAIRKIKSVLSDFDSGPIADAMRRGIESARGQVVS